MNNEQQTIEKERPCVAAHVGTHNIVLDILNEFKPGPVLDVGAGSGHFAGRVKKMWNQEVYVTEIKKECITDTRLIIAEVDSNYDSLPYEDNFFDYITFIEIIEHLKNPWFSLKEINRVLKPNGKLILTTPNIHNVRGKRWFILKNKFPLFENESYNPCNHIHAFTLTELKLILKENNFKIIEILYGEGYNTKVPWAFYKKHKPERSFFRNFIGYSFRNLNYLLSAFASLFLTGKLSTRNRFFSMTTIIVARKNNGK